jgi:hypothetical protein
MANSPIITYKGLEVYTHGSEVDPKFKKGSTVAIPPSIIEKQKKPKKHSRAKLGDSMYERVYESDNTVTIGASYDATSLADFFPVDRRCGMATSVKLNMMRNTSPSIASQVCCATDVPIISVDKKYCTEYTGFTNLAVAADTCVWDTLTADENGVNLIDDEYLPAINEALMIASNMIAVNGDDENNVLGLRNNPYIPSVVIDNPSTVSPITSFRRVTQFIETRNNSIINVTNTLNKRYTLFLPLSFALSLANSTVSFADEQVSLISILAGTTGINANDFAIPKFDIIALEHLENHWNDGVSDVAYMFASDTSGFNEMSRWYKPFSFLDLGSEQKGLREQQFFGCRVGSLEFIDLSKVVRIVIPKS